MVLGVVVDDGAEDGAEVYVEGEEADHDSVVELAVTWTGFVWLEAWDIGDKSSAIGKRECVVLSQMRRRRLTAIHSGKHHEEPIRKPKQEASYI